MNPIMERLGLSRGEEDQPGTCSEGDALVIDCRSCRLTPIPSSDECIRCMVEAMRREGGHDRVVLRTGRDVEISGAAGAAIRDLASVKRWSYSRERRPVRCGNCPVSRDAVMDAAWAVFPKGSVAEGRIALAQENPGREGCETCVMRTSVALDQMEEGIGKVMLDMRDARGVVR